MTVANRLCAFASGWIALALFNASATAQPAARWVGQDGHDFVGTYANPAKSDIQDIHFILSGLPPRIKIASAVVKGEGGGEWKFNGPPGSWLALIVPRAGGAVADLYVEPYLIEKGRAFEFQLHFDNGQATTLFCKGGRADHNLRMPGTGVEARWIGQDRHDRGGPSPDVGPDGIQDVHIGLSKLAAKEEVRSILIAEPGDLRWQFGPNSEAFTGAELVRNPADPTRADLFFQPIRDLAGLTLRLTITYANGKLDSAVVKAGKTDPALKHIVAPIPPIARVAVRSTWLGQTPSGDVRVALDGLPGSGRAVSAFLTDGIVGAWSDKPVEGISLPLTVRPGTDPSKAEVSFPPVRDETGATMTLRLVFADGRSTLADFPGGPADPSLRAPAPEATSVRAKPGDDLNDLANRFGTVTLAAGTYPLSRPLVLNRPVTITSDGGVTLLFSQPATEPIWTAAIKIHAGRTSLDRLIVRFAGPIRWDTEVSYGPCVIGTTDARDKSTGNTLAGLSFTRLDLQAPPPSTNWEEATRLLRLLNTTNGVIASNVLEGGIIELWRGPWQISDNLFKGTHPNEFTYSSVSVHTPHDLTVARNRVKPQSKTGKVWRWLVMTGHGSNVRVAENVVEGVGPRDDDTHPHPNATETILTESYRLGFEGKTSAVSTDGRVISVPFLQGEPAGVGSAVAILSGPQAGEWRRVVMPINPTTFLLDRPVALGGGAISIGPAFFDADFQANSIDARGSKLVNPYVLNGQHFGTRLVKNHIYGGSNSFQIFATGTEAPIHWGWSHNPMFGLFLDANTFEDCWDGVHLAVLHEAQIRATRGRVYMTGTLTNNTFVWTDPFLSAFATARKGATPIALNLGWKPSGDAGEIVINESGNHRQGGKPGPSMKVHMTTLNGRIIKDALIDFSTGQGTASSRRTGAATTRR